MNNNTIIFYTSFNQNQIFTKYWGGCVWGRGIGLQESVGNHHVLYIHKLRSDVFVLGIISGV